MLSIKLILALVIGFTVSCVFGKFYVPWLKKIKAGQETKAEVTWHQSKSGTPTMGGVMFILAITVVCLTVGFESVLHGNNVHLFVLAFAFVFGIIGFLDDWEKLRKKTNLGLSMKAKFLLQLLAAVLFVVLMHRMGHISHSLYIPFWNIEVYIPEWLYTVFAAFVIVGTVNAVNITDGVDGLASGSSIPVFLFFVAVTCLAGSKFLELGIFASGMIGALLGFLVYNYNPAKCFMGDTGSLFLGGAIAALSFAYDIPLVLVTLGFVFIVETLSDIIQIIYFKATGGKRVFKMAPFHHHLEMGGWTGKKWTEKELFLLFFSVSLIFAVISFIGVYQRF